MGETRNKTIKIRLSEKEHQALLARKTRPRLAQWLREIALDQPPRREAKPIDPQLLYELNRIGVNLNQIAKYCNSKKTDIELISVATTLRNIEKALTTLREQSK